MKQQIRKLAQATGQRAVALGLTADDLVAVDEFVEELKEKNTITETTRHIKTEAEKDELRLKVYSHIKTINNSIYQCYIIQNVYSSVLFVIL